MDYLNQNFNILFEAVEYAAYKNDYQDNDDPSLFQYQIYSSILDCFTTPEDSYASPSHSSCNRVHAYSTQVDQNNNSTSKNKKAGEPSEQSANHSTACLDIEPNKKPRKVNRNRSISAPSSAFRSRVKRLFSPRQHGGHYPNNRLWQKCHVKFKSLQNDPHLSGKFNVEIFELDKHSLKNFDKRTGQSHRSTVSPLVTNSVSGCGLGSGASDIHSSKTADAHSNATNDTQHSLSTFSLATLDPRKGRSRLKLANLLKRSDSDNVTASQTGPVKIYSFDSSKTETSLYNERLPPLLASQIQVNSHNHPLRTRNLPGLSRHTQSEGASATKVSAMKIIYNLNSNFKTTLTPNASFDQTDGPNETSSSQIDNNYTPLPTTKISITRNSSSATSGSPSLITSIPNLSCLSSAFGSSFTGLSDCIPKVVKVKQLDSDFVFYFRFILDEDFLKFRQIIEDLPHSRKSARSSKSYRHRLELQSSHQQPSFEEQAHAHVTQSAPSQAAISVGDRRSHCSPLRLSPGSNQSQSKSALPSSARTSCQSDPNYPMKRLPSLPTVDKFGDHDYANIISQGSWAGSNPVSPRPTVAPRLFEEYDDIPRTPKVLPRRPYLKNLKNSENFSKSIDLDPIQAAPAPGNWIGRGSSQAKSFDQLDEVEREAEQVRGTQSLCASRKFHVSESQDVVYTGIMSIGNNY